MWAMKDTDASGRDVARYFYDSVKWYNTFNT